MHVAAKPVLLVVEAHVGEESVVLSVESNGNLRIRVDANALRVLDAVESDRNAVARGIFAIAHVALGRTPEVLLGFPGQVRDVDGAVVRRRDVANHLDRFAKRRRSVAIDGEEPVVPHDQDVGIGREGQAECAIPVVDRSDGHEALVGVQMMRGGSEADDREGRGVPTGRNDKVLAGPNLWRAREREGWACCIRAVAFEEIGR